MTRDEQLAKIFIDPHKWLNTPLKSLYGLTPQQEIDKGNSWKIDHLLRMIDNWHPDEPMPSQPIETIREVIQEQMLKQISDSITTPHKFVTHHTYTGPGCAMCGRPEESHHQIL
jgi:hypothetical protein